MEPWIAPPPTPNWNMDPALKRDKLFCRWFGHKVRSKEFRIYCARCDNTLGDTRDGWPPVPKPPMAPPAPPPRPQR